MAIESTAAGTVAPEPGEKPADACTVVIFGATGDLTRRKLLPALLNLRAHGLVSTDLAVVGVARPSMNDGAFRESLSREVRRFAGPRLDDDAWEGFARSISYQPGEFTDQSTYADLAKTLPGIAEKHRTGGNVLFYLATPPTFFGEIVRRLGEAGLLREDKGAWIRVIIEKPFGRDRDSANALNAEIRQSLRETQIYRIDHYLGKETVQNIMVFRFANGLFEPIWNRRYAEHVEITVAETVGVEGRGGYFDSAGTMRDMIQNHMFQLLALIGMEPPNALSGESVRNEKVKVLQSIRPMTPEQILHDTVRGQYGPGIIDGVRVPGYREEPDVPPESMTETLAAMQLFVENWRWAGVPFYLRSGKRLPRRSTEIVIQFRKPPLMLFPRATLDDVEANQLVMRIQPEEGIRIAMKAKRPGPTVRLRDVDLAFDYSDPKDDDRTTGYERLLYDCMIGDTTLFHREDMVDAAWSIATPILDLWGSLPARDFPNYAAGSWGPPAAEALITKHGHPWSEPA